MSEKNILEKMTVSYDRATEVPDLGNRVYALNALKEKIDRFSKMSITDRAKKEQVQGSAHTNAALLGGAALTTAISVITPEAIPWYFDTLIGIGSFIGAGASVGNLTGWGIRKNYERKDAAYIRDILPHIPALKDLSQKIKCDVDDLLTQKNATALRNSSKLGRLMADYPKTLTGIFEAVAQSEYEQQKQQPKPEDKKGFVL